MSGFMENWPQDAIDLLCPFCGHSQNTMNYWEDVEGMETESALYCQACEKEILVTRQCITWFEVRPSMEQMIDKKNCATCRDEEYPHPFWDKDARNAYHHDDQREQGGKIEKVYHDPPFQEYAA